MNLVYRSLWNERTGIFVAVSEHARSAGKPALLDTRAKRAVADLLLELLALPLLLPFVPYAYALPAGGMVVAGGASISNTAGSSIITQSSQNVAINWQSFNIGKGEAVRFVQPNANSVALNRVLGADPSSILGSLSANGKIFLVNPNGILFGQGASVNVGGLVASTLDIDVGDFMAGRYQFAGNSRAAVLNQGMIEADGGYVALLGANIGNDGSIQARLGTVALAAGNAITLDVAGDGLLSVTVSRGAVDALVRNGGVIQADGGQVLLTAQAAGNLLPSAVNTTGMIQAQTIENRNGTIRLLGDMQSGTVNVGGTLDASAPNGGNGGFIETSAAHVKLARDAKITTAAPLGQTGTWLIDPFDYTVGTGGDIEGSALGTALDLNNVTISSNDGSTGTDGDIRVNAAVTWTAATTLSLNAVRDVTVNAAMTATNGSLAATAGRDINLNAATTVTTGTVSAIAGHDVTVNAAMTVTTGDIVLHADSDGTGPGALIGGTVTITCGANCLTITTGTLEIRFNPVSYGATAAEITAYDANLTGAGVLDAKAWVFGKADSKVYDGTTTATVTALKRDITAALPPVALGAVASADFADKNVGTSKLVTFDAVVTDAAYTLFATDEMPPGHGTARADITPLALLGSITVADKPYDATTTAIITGRTLTGVLGTDELNYTGGIATFDTSAAGVGKVVTANGLGLAGADATNYTVNPTASTTATITPLVPPPVVVIPPVEPPPVEPPPGEPPPAEPLPIEPLPIEPTPVEPTPVEPILIAKADFAVEEMMGGEVDIVQSSPPGIAPPLKLRIVRARLPTQLLSLVPVVAALTPEAPVIMPQAYVPPQRLRKQDRN